MLDIPKKSKKFILKQHFDGLPKLENFQLVEEDIPALQTGGTELKVMILYVWTFIIMIIVSRN